MPIRASLLAKPYLSLLYAGAAMAVWLLAWLHAYVGPIDHSRLSYSSYLTDKHGELLHVLLADDQRLRIRTELQDVDGHYLSLLLAYEDQRFWAHHGVDWLAMSRAIWQLLSTGRIVSGGSTLTMQAVRLMEPKPRTVWNKLDQMRKAIALERQYSKPQVLQRYLSLAPFGGNIEGVNAASLRWFNKWPAELTPAEAALLVALPQSPESRRPDRHPQRATKARNQVLQRALTKGIIDSEYLHTANLSPVPQRPWPLAKNAMHLAWSKRLQAVEYQATSIDTDIQNRLSDIAQRHPLPPGLNMAVLVAESQTGKIIAYIGSQDYFNFANHGAIDYTQAVRSPGSTLKPFIYGLAQANGDIHFNTLIKDSVTDIQGYQPLNLSKRFVGEVTISEALQRSLNTPAVKVLDRYGPDKFKGKLASAGIALHNGKGLPIALGGAGTSLTDLVSLYTALGNDGNIMPLTTDLHAQQQATKTFTQHSAQQLNWILSNNAGQQGKLHGAQQLQAVAYKTGTGPGGSDALALANNGKYTIGIWVGSPDGGAVANNTGLRSAVPIMHKVMDQLPKGRLAVTAIGKPPTALTTFNQQPAKLKIHYPVHNSELQMRKQHMRLHLDLAGATYPIWATINGQTMQQLKSANQSLLLPTKGAYSIHLVDSQHQSGKVNFYLK